MALTRIRAEQISDIDYKQAVRVIELTNVTLSGGTPNTVDGVSLNVKDRILVAGQNTASQNGLYDVSVVGSGSNGTWTRTSDANYTGEINAGMIVMITEGNTWADTSWKLITNDPIVIGTTSLTFLQNTGNSFSIINVVGSANVVANGVSSTVSFASGNNISITGNSAADIVTFSVPDSPSFVGNVTAGNLLTTGQLSATGNIITAGYFLGTFAGNISGNLTVPGSNTQVIYNNNGNAGASAGFTFDSAANAMVVTGNITGGNLTTTGNITATGVGGNITANNLIGNTVNWTSNGSVAVYQIYNAGTTSLDTIFI
jgi:hypothetical protein